MTAIPDKNFEASIEQYHKDTYAFRQMLDNRTEEEMVRDDYVLDQHSRGKRMKVVLRKASKKLKRPELSPESPHYQDWLNYFEHLMSIIVNDIKIEAYYKYRMGGAEPENSGSEKETPE
jgi:hypothetical protein